jgi:hypothetical protein
LPSQFGGLSLANASSTGAATQSALQSQPTGLGGSSVRLFQPASSFGASLAAQRFAASPGPGLAAQMTGNPFARVASPTSAPPAPLAPQPTGLGGSSVPPFQPSSDFGRAIRNDIQPNLLQF